MSLFAGGCCAHEPEIAEPEAIAAIRIAADKYVLVVNFRAISRNHPLLLDTLVSS
jgi:hypothetical protein